MALASELKVRVVLPSGNIQEMSGVSEQGVSQENQNNSLGTQSDLNHTLLSQGLWCYIATTRKQLPLFGEFSALNSLLQTGTSKRKQLLLNKRMN